MSVKKYSRAVKCDKLHDCKSAEKICREFQFYGESLWAANLK